MSKELTPLKALKELKERYGKNFSLNDDERCRIIEKSLKSQEQYVQIAEKEHEDYMTLCGEITRLKNKNKKQEKALEIIKKKRVNCFLLIAIFNSSDNIEHYNQNYSKNWELTKEEYDLLKEVLL